MTVADREREERFDALFRQYLPDMVAYCGWRSGSQADGQDAVADVFLAAWRKLDEVPEGDEARLWLYGTGRRVLANQARAGRRRIRLSARAAEAYGGDEAPAEDAVVAQSATALPAVVDAVHLALSHLAPADREVLLLAEWEGLTPTQIAAVMGCPTVTARGRLFRARRRFRQAYEALPERSAPAESSVSAEPGACASRSTQGVVPCS
jgi:RNA polymerase sigma-70 factor (ECF subfamily)